MLVHGGFTMWLVFLLYPRGTDWANQGDTACRRALFKSPPPFTPYLVKNSKDQCPTWNTTISAIYFRLLRQVPSYCSSHFRPTPRNATSIPSQ
ncbi:hypothetical protein BO78DRAFT_61167 [Aspergillus sclerotiicarbonarius CBS 121057]|uniref:Secreted protein n=1 Tax=Aspergillus sclerotiicarbonarius (strain CBS 121057 / IBT 28362) TaxID=1448318 RepID=A0A319EGJ1_ASPSB|nr:hypothetical protein BO78DRAFT_61167 [Aspergillus sclerotiicarbonarius CBS 121057]